MGSSTPDVAKPPSYSALMQSALKGQAKVAPKMIALEQQYSPQLTALNLQGLQGALFGTPGAEGYMQTLQKLAPEYRQMEAEDTAALRAEELKQLGQFAPEYVQSYRQAAGTQGLLAGLQQQAQQELDAGTSLTPEETRQAQQAARAAYASRGMGLSNRAIGAELMNQYGMGQQRLQQRRQFAAQTAGQLEQSGMPQYYQTMMGGGSLQNLMGLSGAAQGYSGVGFFNPESQMNADLASQGIQARNAASAAGAANRSAMVGAGMGLAGSAIVGAALI